MIFLIPRTFALASNVLSFLCVLLAVMLAFGAKSVSAQTTIYSEDFQSYSENYGFRNGGNSGGYDGTETNWTIAGNTSTLTGNNDYFMVEFNNGSQKFGGRDLDGEFIWTSKEIDVSGYTALTFGVDLGEAGGMEPDDYIKLYYIKDDGSEVLIDEIFDDYGSATMSEDSFESTTSLKFRLKARNDGSGEIHRFDNLLLTGTPCAPVISSVSGATLNLDASGSVTVTASSANVTATDPCSTGSLSYYVSTSAAGPFTSSTVDLDCNATSGVTLYFQVEDGNGNTSSTSSAVFTSVDVTDPTVVASDVSASLCVGESSVAVSATDVIDSDGDNCSVATREIKLTSAADSEYASSLSFTAAGDYPVTVQVKDPTGNGATATVTVTISGAPSGVLYTEDFEDESTNTDLCSPSAYTPSDNNWTPLCPGGTSSISTLSSGDEAFRIAGAGGAGSPLTFQVSNNNDDAEERTSNGDMGLTSSDLELGRDGSNSQEVGIRFRNVSIPQGATVVSAYIQFTVDESDTESTSVTIQIQDTGNAAQYSSSDDDISSRSYTSGSVAWNNIPSWTSEGASGADQATPDLTSLVQEVVNRGDWASGNALAFRITGTGQRTADSHDGDSNSAPELVIELESNGGSAVATTWESAAFNVSCLSNVLLEFDARSEGDLENSGPSLDEFDVYAVKDGVESLLFGADGHLDGSGGGTPINDSFSQGIGLTDVSQLAIRIKARLTLSSESYSFDDFKVCVDENDNGLCDVDECTNIAVTASSPTVDLDGTGSVTISAGTSGADITTSSTGDCFTVASFEVSKTNATNGFGSSVSFDCTETGAQNVWVRATDGTDVSAATATTVTVQDVTPPTIGALSGTYYLGEGGESTASTRRIWWATATDGNGDNCGLAIKKVSKTGNDWGSATNYVDFDCTELGPQTVYLQGTDAAGNVAEGSGTITIADNTPPTITAPGQVNANTSSYGGTCSVTASSLFLGTPTTSDNCSGASVTNDAPSSYPLGTTVVTWTVTDASGNTATATQDVVVTEDQIPTISSVSSSLTEVLSSAGAATIDAATYITASDNCTASESLTFEISESTGSGFAATFVVDCDDIGAKTFYFRVTDASGNVSSESSETITIADNTAPTAVANAVTLFLSGGTVTLNATNGSFNTSTDACGVSTSEVKLSSAGDGTFASSLTFTSEDDYDVTLRVTDASSNVATSTATVSVLFTVVNGCIDQTACNYDASANTDDGSCTFPGEECSSPSAGQGFVYTVNAAEDGCDCTAQDFEQLYFEDFTGDLNSGVVDGTPTDYVSLCPGGFSPADGNWLTDGCDDGTTSFTNGDFASVFVYPEDLSGNPSDLSFNWYATGGATTSFDLSFNSKLIDVQGYTDLKFDADVVNLLTDDSGVGLEFATLFDDVRTVQSSVSGSFGRSGLNTTLPSINADDLVVEVRGFGDGPTADLYLDDVTVAAWGKEGCTDSNASSGYDATAQVDDGSCVYAFAAAYSRYDGGFQEKIWAGTSCGEDCGSAPYFDAKQVAANSQTSSSSFNYVISSGTTVTVNGTTDVDGDPTTKDLFVNNLTIEDGGSLMIPAGKRLRVMGTFIDNDGNAVSGDGMLCIDGTFTFGTGEGSPSTVNVQDFELTPSATLTVPGNKTLAVNGNLAFGSTDPSAVSGLVSLSGSSAQTITGDGATLDELEISNSAGVIVNDSLEIQGRLKLSSGELDLGDNILVFASNSESGSEEKTAVLDAIPSGASLTGTLSSGGRMAQSMSSGDANVVVERYIAADTDGVTYTGYTLFGSPIDGAVVGDLDGIDGFYLAGWPGTSWPNSFSSILFWDEANSAFVEPASNNTPLDTLGGAWIVIAGSQTPTMSTAGALNSHLEGDSKTFALTRSDNSNTADEFEGWNLIYNPYQARLDWHEVLGNSGNAALVEDQYAVYDTQAQQFVRYSETNTSMASASRYIEPGQSFWVRLPSGTTSGTFTLTPDMIDNDAAGAEFVRSAAEGEVSVLLETRNAYGATQSLLRFSDNGDAEAYLDGDLSRLSSSSVKSGELAFWADGQQYVAKTLPQDVDGEFYVRSRANFETTIRVLEVTGAVSFCGHIEDGETGEVMLLQEGEELVFTLPAHDAEAGRFTLHGERFAEATGLAPDCPDSEAGMIVVELADVVADLTVVNYETMEQVGLALQATGTVELPMSPGEYSIVVEATEETSLCRGGRRQVVVAPGEQPELLGLIAEPSECNFGMASLAFELYGNGEFETSLIQGAQTMWSASLAPGEHVLEDIIPGDYVLKVNHACMEATEWVSLSDPGMPEVTPIYPFFTEVEAAGGAWLEASCMGCITGEGYGYQWMVDGAVVAENEPMAVRVYEAGLYEVELVAFGPDCQMNVPFEMLVGQHKVASSDKVTWVMAEEGQLMGDFKEEWVNAQIRWFDSTGRLLKEESKGSLMGRVMLDAPKAGGWLTLEVRSASGRLSRWFGVH